nr:MAG TPA: hypothetical protein [Caudoviricetes sp.]
MRRRYNKMIVSFILDYFENKEFLTNNMISF